RRRICEDDLHGSKPRLALLLVRTWNVFHGNAKPPERHAFLEEMVRLAATDRPDVLCLQEVPVWALDRLAAWCGMTATGAGAAGVPGGSRSRRGRAHDARWEPARYELSGGSAARGRRASTRRVVRRRARGAGRAGRPLRRLQRDA